MSAERVVRRRLPATASVTSRMDLVSVIQRSASVLVLAVVLVVGAVAFGGSFASARNLSNVAIAASFLAIVAAGMTFVIISGGIDLSVGSMLALGAVLAAYSSRWGSAAAVVAPLVVCGGIGVIQGLLIGRRGLPPFIVTLAGLLFARGLAFYISDDGNTTHLIAPGMKVSVLGQGRIVFGIGIPVLIAAAVYVAGFVQLNRTRFGQAVYAVGGAEEAAKLGGVRVSAVKVRLYAASGFLAGLAGLLVAARSSSGLSTIGVGLELEAIAAVVIGGTLLSGGSGSLTGTLAGVLLLEVIQNLINQVGTLSSYFQQVVSGTFLIVVVIVQAWLSRRQRR